MIINLNHKLFWYSLIEYCDKSDLEGYIETIMNERGHRDKWIKSWLS